MAVTGCSGFLGRYVVEALVEKGHEVIGLDVVEPSMQLTDFRRRDFTSMTDAVEGLRGASFVCHLGGVGDVYLADKDPALAFRANGFGTKVVCDAALELGIEGLVYASTWEVYGKPEKSPVDETHPCNPETPYSISKLAGELLARHANTRGDLTTTILRLGTAYGPFMRDSTVISRFLSSAVRGNPLVVFGRGTQFRQFTHARDIGRAFSRVVTHGRNETTLNIVADEQVTIRALAELVASQFGVEIEFTDERVGEPPSAAITSAKAHQYLGWEADVTFAEGLRELVDMAR